MRSSPSQRVIALLILGVVLTFGPLLILVVGDDRFPRTTAPATISLSPSPTPLATMLQEPTIGVGKEIIFRASPPSIPVTSGPQKLTLLGSPQGILTLDPALVQDADSGFVVRQVFRGLVDFDDHLAPVPALAQEIRISSDGLRYIFVLRDQLVFQDGTPLRADDVKFSFERAMDPGLHAGDGRALPAWNVFRDVVGAEDRMRGQRNDVSGIRVLDQQTIEIQLTRPSPTFLLRLATPPAFIVSRANVEAGPTWWRHPNGSGPFRVSQWTDRLLVLTGVSTYRPFPPVLQEIRIRLGVDAIDGFGQYERGQVDIADVPLSELDRVLAPNSVYRNQLQVQQLFSGTFLFINPNVPPFIDPAVRHALMQAVNVDKIVHVTLQGRVPEANGILPPGILGQEWKGSLPHFSPHDVAPILRAATAVAPLTIVSSGSALPVVIAKTLERDVGISVQVLRYDWPDYLTDLYAHRFGCFLVNWVADYPDPEAFLGMLFRSDSPDNLLSYRDPELDALLDDAAHTPDPFVRASDYQAVQQRLLDAAVVVPLYHDVAYVLVRPSVHGLPLTPLGILGLEHVWIAGS